MIKRSIGTPITVASIPYLVGSGYQGKTEELDNIVKQEAELLTKTFNRDIEIRFNSDRESGGAWLVNSLKGFDGNCQISLGAGMDNMRRIYIYTFVDHSALKNKILCNSGNPDSRYCSLGHKSVENALSWLITNVAIDKIHK